MTDEEMIQRSRLARQVFYCWGHERAEADAGVIESASQALARLERMRPEATVGLDGDEEPNRA